MTDTALGDGLYFWDQLLGSRTHPSYLTFVPAYVFLTRPQGKQYRGLDNNLY